MENLLTFYVFNKNDTEYKELEKLKKYEGLWNKIERKNKKIYENSGIINMDANIIFGSKISVSSFYPGRLPIYSIDRNPNTGWHPEKYEKNPYIEFIFEKEINLKGLAIMWIDSMIPEKFKVYVLKSGMWKEVKIFEP